VIAFQGGPELQQIAQGGARMQRIGEVVNQIGLEITARPRLIWSISRRRAKRA
jgi:hypothetical protein